MTRFSHVIAKDKIAVYKATQSIFEGLIKEIRELSKKKPDATLSASKVQILNRVLEDLKGLLDKEPEGKFLDLLDDENLPQTSDAVLIMVQFETALDAFFDRYTTQVKKDSYSWSTVWVTPDFVKRNQ